MTDIRLDYTINERGARSANELQALLAAADIFEGELDLLQMTVVADVSTAVPLARRITLRTNAASDVLFPTNAALIFALTRLYSSALDLKVPARIIAGTPVIL